MERHESVASAEGLCDFDSAVRYLAESRPGALVIDLRDDETWRDAQRLHAHCHETLVIAIAASDTGEELVRCARIGCAGVIRHDSSIDRCVATIRRALGGELRCSPAAAASLMRAVAHMAGHGAAETPGCLTRRESEVCALLCQGLTNKEIARDLRCSQGTVKNHIHNILSKLNVSRRSAVHWHIESQARDVPGIF